MRELRAQQGHTLLTLAGATGLSSGYLSQLERGKVSPSVDTLGRLARFYDVPVSFFFEEDPDGISVIRRGQHLILRPARASSEFELLSPDLNRRIEFLRITIEPKGSTHREFNSHPGEEVHYVLQGQIEVQLDDHVYELGRGDSIYFQSNIPHLLRNSGKTQAVVFTALSPPTRWAKEMASSHVRARRRKGKR